jgi:hypothetical protein
MCNLHLHHHFFSRPFLLTHHYFIFALMIAVDEFFGKDDSIRQEESSNITEIAKDMIEKGKELNEVLAHFSDAHTANNILNRKAAYAMAVSAPWNVLQKSTCAEVEIVDELRGQLVEALVRPPPIPPPPSWNPLLCSLIKFNRFFKKRLDQLSSPRSETLDSMHSLRIQNKRVSQQKFLKDKKDKKNDVCAQLGHP